MVIVLSTNDFGDGCYLIDEGIVRVELLDRKTGTNTVLGLVEAGGVLGEFSFLDGKPRSANAYADTDVKARWFRLKSFETMCKDDPSTALHIALSIGQDLAAKMREFNQKIHDYIFMQDIDQKAQKILSPTSVVPRKTYKTSVSQINFKKAVQDRTDTAVRLYGWGAFSGL